MFNIRKDQNLSWLYFTTTTYSVFKKNAPKAIWACILKHVKPWIGKLVVRLHFAHDMQKGAVRRMLLFVCMRTSKNNCVSYCAVAWPLSSFVDTARSDRIVLVKMMVKLAFPLLAADYPDVDMLRCKDWNHFATECVVPRRPKRNLPPLPEDKECSNTELRKCSKTVHRRRKYRRLPSLPEHDECWFFGISVCATLSI